MRRGEVKLVCVAVGDIGKKIREAREDMRPRPKQTEFAAMLNISQGRLGNWETGKHDPPGDIVSAVARITGKPLQYFYGDDTEKSQNTQTNVYHTGDDSEPDIRLLETAFALSDPRTIRVNALVVGSSGVWSAKGAQREPVNVYALQNGSVLKVKDDNGHFPFPDGTVFCIKPDDFAHTDTYLLVQNKANPDLHALRFIDSLGKGTELVADDPAIAPLKLSEWTVVGFPNVLIQGAGLASPRAVIRPDGFGPRKQ